MKVGCFAYVLNRSVQVQIDVKCHYEKFDLTGSLKLTDEPAAYTVVTDENSFGTQQAVANGIASDLSGLRARPFSANYLWSAAKQSSKL